MKGAMSSFGTWSRVNYVRFWHLANFPRCALSRRSRGYSGHQFVLAEGGFECAALPTSRVSTALWIGAMPVVEAWLIVVLRPQSECDFELGFS
jgi:hypothetical protein